MSDIGCHTLITYLSTAMKTSVKICSILYTCFLFVLNFNSTEGNCHNQWPSCGSDKNVVCETDYGKPVAHCRIIFATPLFRKTITDSHNHYRNHVAIGNETRGAFRNVADMRAISYDSYLEFTAQCQTAKCDYDHNTACYATKNFSDVGQNLNGRVDEEDSNHTFATIEETKKMVSEWYNMMVCNYGPRGLRVTKALGKFGPPCSRCPEKPEPLSCNKDYPGLCGEIDESHYNLTISEAVKAFNSRLCTWLTTVCFVLCISVRIRYNELSM